MNIEEVSLNDPEVWDMIGQGRTKGCFQIESHLGKTWCKKLKPQNIEELSDLISIVRPGVLHFQFNGKSMAQHYADRKNKIDEAKPVHPALYDILKSTQQVFLFQEQIMWAAKDLAGFSDSEVNSLRKAIGKKNAKDLFELEKKFVEGCVKTGKVDKEGAELIFDNVKSSARYLFCKSLCPETTYVEKINGDTCKIKDINIGDEIKTPTGYSKVLDKLDHGILDVFEVLLDDGKTIRCTVNHKFLCASGKILPLWQILLLDEDILSE